MKWDKYTIATTTAAEDIISAMLSGLGIEGVEIENNVPLTKEETGSMFIDFPPQLPPDDGTSRVSFYLEAGQNHEGLIQDVQDALADEAGAVCGYRHGTDYKGADRGRRLDE